MRSGSVQPARLLVINNMPSFYRTPAFAQLIETFSESTGGSGLVVYQVRRDERQRGEWFYTPDEDLTYPHVFLSTNAPRSSRLPHRPVGGLSVLLRYRPTHIFAAGWDSPASIAASCYARTTRAAFGIWVESSPLTSSRTGRLSNAFRKQVLAPAGFSVVPSAASEEYVSALAGRPVSATRLLNPVDLARLPEPRPEIGTRMVFLGDFSLRKGFDRFAAAASVAATHGIPSVAWGRDVEGLAGTAASVDVHPAVPLPEILPHLRASDILVIPSRTDPAPLTYSEALALGLRVVVSDSIAYRDHARYSAGVAVVDPSRPDQIVEAVNALRLGERPPVSASAQVSVEHFATQITRSLLECRPV